MTSYAAICLNCSVIAEESDDVEYLISAANDLICSECGFTQFEIDDDSSGEHLESGDRCEECNSTHVEDPPEEWSHVLGLHCLDCGHVQM